MLSQPETSGNRRIFLLAGSAALWLLCNLVALPLAWGGINADGGVLAVVQAAVLLGFLFIFCFDVATLAWITLRRSEPRLGARKLWLQALAVLALVGLAGSKVMVDEIARETPLGRAGGEWGVLYALLILQLSYILVVLFKTKPVSG